MTLQRSPEGELNQDLVSSTVGRPTSLGSAIASAGILPPSHRDRLRSWLARRGVSLEDAEDAIGPQELDQIQQIQSLLRQLEQRANPGSGRPEVERELAPGQSGMASDTQNAAPSEGADGHGRAEQQSAGSVSDENAGLVGQWSHSRVEASAEEGTSGALGAESHQACWASLQGGSTLSSERAVQERLTATKERESTGEPLFGEREQQEHSHGVGATSSNTNL